MSYGVDKSRAAQISFWHDFLSKPVFQRSETDTDRAVVLLRTNAPLKDMSDEALETLSKHATIVEMAQGQRLETVQVAESRLLKPASDMIIIIDGRIHWSYPAEQRHARVVGQVFDAGEMLVGSKLFRSVLPPGATFVCEQRGTTALVISEEFTLTAVTEYDVKEMQGRMSFLRTLTVPLVTSWTDDEVSDLARALVPMKLASHTVVVREHEVSDALFFVRSGKLKVVREIDFSVASQPNAKLLELATLCAGEYFGELGLLSRDVDAARATTLNKAEISALVKEPLLPDSWEQKRRANAPGGSARIGATGSRSGGGAGGGAVTAATSGENILSVDSSVVKTRLDEHGEPVLVTKPRQATVYAHTVVELLMLPVDQFDDLFVRASTSSRAHATVALLKMREYALGYPTQGEVRAYFLKQKRWAEYKGSILNKSGHHANPDSTLASF